MIGGERSVCSPRSHVAALYRQGQSVAQMVAEHPPLTAAQVHAAISSSLQHRDEIEALLEQHQRRAVLRAHYLASVAGRGPMPPERLAALPNAARAVWDTAATVPEDWG